MPEGFHGLARSGPCRLHTRNKGTNENLHGLFSAKDGKRLSWLNIRKPSISGCPRLHLGANPFVPIGMNWNENADWSACKLLKIWWPETLLNSCTNGQ